MREILFKAKRTDNGEWAEGYYLSIGDKTYIICEAETSCIDGENTDLYATEWYEVDHSTICWCTGLKDKNGNLIWENDIVKTVYDGELNPNYVVVWDKDELDFKATNGKEHYKTNYEYLGCCDEIVVIGNAFDNLQLLENGN